MRPLLTLFVCGFLCAADFNWMPVPATHTRLPGRLPITPDFTYAITGVSDPLALRAAERALARITKQTQIRLVRQAVANPALLLRIEHPASPVQKLNDVESYSLVVTSRQAKITAANPLGVIRGLATLSQLVEQDATGKWSIPAVSIEDHPRFSWRGLHLDASRHWMPIPVVKRTLDGMEAVKLNVFHWHLSDDQGFRVESRRFPRLHENASGGNYYRQDEIRSIIAYAHERGIRVVPEFDMPGHVSAMLAAYPELGSMPGPYGVERRWSGFDPPLLDPTKDSVYEFLDAFIGEMAGLFPDDFFHIGGDEVISYQWTANPAIVDFMKERGMKTKHDLQHFFNKRLQAIVAKHGKRMEGWDEILNPDLPKDTVIQSWRGPRYLLQAARLGYPGIVSAGYYLDHMKPASYHYLNDPVRGAAKGILGGEACMWTEFVDERTVDSRIWPRAAAMAERFWSPAIVRDVDSMYRRLNAVSRQLTDLGLTHETNYERMLNELAQGAPVAPIRALADVLEPVKMYARNRGHKYTQSTPLNRLVDAVRPESPVAHDFEVAIKRKDWKTVRATLTAWRDNKPVLTGTLAEAQALSDTLNQAAELGLAILDHKPVRRAAFVSMKKSTAELRVAVIPAIQALAVRR